MQNGALYNPSYTMSENQYTAYWNSQVQWVGFAGAPKSSTLGIYGPYNEKIGFGVNFMSKSHGAMTNYQSAISYAYRGKLSDDHFFMLGLSTGIRSDRLNTRKLTGDVNMNDPYILSNQYNRTFFAASVGITYHYKQFEGQFAMPHLFARQAAKFYSLTILSYNHQIDGDKWKIKPSVMFAGASITKQIFDVSIMGEWNNLFWAQVGYRSTNTIIYSAGINYKNYRFGYAYRDDMDILGMASTGTHDFQFIVRFGSVKKGNIKQSKQQVTNYSGTIVNKHDKKPVISEIIIRNDAGDIVKKLITDEQGNYSVNLDQGKVYKLEINAQNYQTYETILTGNKIEQNKLNISLLPKFTALSGNCNAPNAQIFFLDENENLVKSTLTDNEGNFSVRLEAGMEFKAKIIADGYVSETISFKLPNDVSEKNIDFSLKAILPLKGSIKNRNSGDLLVANINIFENDKSILSQSVNGSFEVKIPEGEYVVEVTGENIITLRENIKLNEATARDYFLDLKVTQMSQDKTFTLGIVNFAPGKALILEDSYKVLDDLVKIMKDNPEIKIEISGHSDNTGNTQLNINLSNDRAQSCKEYVISKGISADRLTSIGYGPNKPIVENDTPSKRAKNRRVEFKIID